MESDYIINFERINQLTSTIHDGTSDIGLPYSVHSISKNIIKQYMEIFTNRHSRRADNTKLVEVIETLRFNGIILSKSDIRDIDINKILEE